MEGVESSRSNEPSHSYPFRLDEGFHEDSTRTSFHPYAETDADSIASSFQAWVMSQNETARAEIAYEVLRTLRTSTLSTVVDRLTPLLHMDPIEKLPPEITGEIFSYLDASTLLTASLASSTWRERILDPALWQKLYRSEGWGIDMEAVRAFERNRAHTNRGTHLRNSKGKLPASTNAPYLHGTSHSEQTSSCKRRATSEKVNSQSASADVSQWRDQHGIVEADTDESADDTDVQMQDASFNSQYSPAKRPSAQNSPVRPQKRHSQDSGDETDHRRRNGNANSFSDPAQRLLMPNEHGSKRLNWPHVYKQRHKLEMNWINGRYVNFQLPHPLFPHEAHTECVYTIQFFGKWLVSGSRDKTLRIWDLETRRLRGKPLTGHSQSVLCLQFDPTEDEDIIISGSSDASIIVWRFSTGQKLHVINSAHSESVLNLRFDKRYLVTCSKDKKIKVWNRNALTPLDADYPAIDDSRGPKRPSYIIDPTSMDINLLEAKIASGVVRTLEPYTLLMSLEGHSAAVNAIQIYGGLIVSASGDRLIRIWNTKTGHCLRSVPGHQKGIACVQFDGRRIVSGSSDNTVRIFDPTTGAEVAVLLGHANLVRTVQAGFGDAPGYEHDDLSSARVAQSKYLQGIANGEIPDDHRYARRVRGGEFGSSRMTFGSKLPPGGGGSKWGRIVSGSYDESIIIWKKDDHGNWVVGQTLRQEAAIRASVDERNAVRRSQGMVRTSRQPQQQQSSHQHQPQQRDQGMTPAIRRSQPHPREQRPERQSRQPLPVSQQTGQTGNGVPLSPTQIVTQAMNASMAGIQTGLQSVMGLSRGLNSTIHMSVNVPGQRSFQYHSSTGPANANSVTTLSNLNGNHNANNSTGRPVEMDVNRLGQAVQNASHNAVVHNSANAALSTNGRSGSSQSQSTSVPTPASDAAGSMSVQVNSNASEPSTPATSSATPQQPPPPTQGHRPNQQAVNGGANDRGGQAAPAAAATAAQPAPVQSMARVFKLQFDARHIISCSQDSRIIGWDFTNGDPEIVECCQFFTSP